MFIFKGGCPIRKERGNFLGGGWYYSAYYGAGRGNSVIGGFTQVEWGVYFYIYIYIYRGGGGCPVAGGGPHYMVGALTKLDCKRQCSPRLPPLWETMVGWVHWAPVENAIINTYLEKDPLTNPRHQKHLPSLLLVNILSITVLNIGVFLREVLLTWIILIS